MLYYPIQIPYILSKTFAKYCRYSEEKIDTLSEFVICCWQMRPAGSEHIQLENIVVADGCIDLIADFNTQEVGFAGMSKTAFHFSIDMPMEAFGFRLCPGAFSQLTKHHPQAAMDHFLPIKDVFDDFDMRSFFLMPFDEAKRFLAHFLERKLNGLIPDEYTRLFNELSSEPPATVTELCSILHVSRSVCQRNFRNHYGLTPKMVLSILRFQRALDILTSAQAQPSDPLDAVSYYDQSHFINDFKLNIGLTPRELLAKYKD